VLTNPHQTIHDVFGVTEQLRRLEKASTGEASIEELEDVDWTIETRVLTSLKRFGLAVDPTTPMALLSGGQRVRASLAACLFDAPDFLLLDEPTNNLDREGRRAVSTLLENCSSGIIVVSHDRELLQHVDAIVELTPLGLNRYGGDWDDYKHAKELSLAAIEHELLAAESRVNTIAETVQLALERKSRKDAAGRLTKLRGGIPHILSGTRKDRAESTRGNSARLAERRLFEAERELNAVRAKIEVKEDVLIDLPSTLLPRQKKVLELTDVTVGYDAERPVLQGLDLQITGPERVAIVGANGSGKTTVLRLISGNLLPLKGRVEVFTSVASLDQYSSLLDPTLSIRENYMRTNPESDENTCRAALARFRFRSEAALGLVSTLSGGKRVLASLACVLAHPTPPALVILDEPANHLDLVAMIALEAGLRAYDGALLVVSHDQRFLDAINVSRELDITGFRAT
jgi:ATPase subunit of ABC transporter with duplicated ATPase domains